MTILFHSALAVITSVLLIKLFPVNNEIGYYPLYISLFVILFFIIFIGILYKKFGIVNRSLRFRIALHVVIFSAIAAGLISTFPYPWEASPIDIYSRFRHVREDHNAVDIHWIALDRQNPANYEKLIAARKKIEKELLPDEYFIITYNAQFYPFRDTSFMLYLKNDLVVNSRRKLSLYPSQNEYLVTDVFENRALEYFLLKSNEGQYFFTNNKSIPYNKEKVFNDFEQNNIKIEVSNISKMNGFNFESYGIYKLMNFFL